MRKDEHDGPARRRKQVPPPMAFGAAEKHCLGENCPCHKLEGPRLPDVFHLLAAGQSEKEIAAALEISIHTVHNHVRCLHEQFQVNTHGEFMAKVLCRGSFPDNE